jgi:hypothetical protein
MATWRNPRVWSAAALVAAYTAGAIVGAERSSSAMASSATTFLASLNAAQKSQATFPFDGDERTRWHFIPTEMFARRGLTVGEMTGPQRTAAHALLKAGLSERGYLTATAIMELENVLGAIEAAQRQSGAAAESFRRDPTRYFFSIFGTPSTTGTWGWRVEGHHVSLQFTVVNGTLVAAAPTFFGSNPAEVREGPRKGLRLLGAEEDTARALLDSLDAAQKARAVIAADAPGDILTMAKVQVESLSPAGITADALRADQRKLLMNIVDVYTGFMAPDIAQDRVEKLERAGVEKLGFVWAGATARGQKHYYRVQGPTFLIEYDNTQNDGNHIHSVWRDFAGDFGRDLLQEHLRSAAH